MGPRDFKFLYCPHSCLYSWHWTSSGTLLRVCILQFVSCNPPLLYWRAAGMVVSCERSNNHPITSQSLVGPVSCDCDPCKHLSKGIAFIPLPPTRLPPLSMAPAFLIYILEDLTPPTDDVFLFFSPPLDETGRLARAGLGKNILLSLIFWRVGCVSVGWGGEDSWCICQCLFFLNTTTTIFKKT